LVDAWVVEVRLVDVVEVVFGAITEFTVLVTFCTVDCTGFVVDVDVCAGGLTAVVVGVVVGVGTVVAPAGTKPATDPAANKTPDVAMPIFISSRFRLMSAPSV
jgi:hypothetical protein